MQSTTSTSEAPPPSSFFFAQRHLLIKHCWLQQQFCSLTARPHSQVTEDACLQPRESVCVCAFFVWRSFNSRWYFWNLLEHFNNPIILSFSRHQHRAVCQSENWQECLPGVYEVDVVPLNLFLWADQVLMQMCFHNCRLFMLCINVLNTHGQKLDVRWFLIVDNILNS